MILHSPLSDPKMNGVEPYAYLRDLFTRLANGHLDKDIDALMPWA
jgi:transposase